jgi:putative component of membrane protein insertase Oxa1/YidC/SpoIIIJ protein YidD
MNPPAHDETIDRRVTELGQAIADALDPGNLERRTSERYAYPTIQMAAPCGVAGDLGESIFRPVRCHDISRGGISFVWPAQPDFTEVVVGLSDGPGSVRLKARVLRCIPVADPHDSYLVCCHFIERLA